MSRIHKQQRRRQHKVAGRNRTVESRINLTSMMGGLMGPPEAHYDDGCPECVAKRPDAVPSAPRISAEALATAEARCQAWLAAHPLDRQAAYADARFERQGLTAAEQAHLARFVDDWLLCDAGWPKTVVAGLAAEAEAAGEGEVAQALMARHHARLMGVHALPADPKAPRLRGVTKVVRPADGSAITLRWTPPRALGTGTFLVLRLFPAAGGGWAPAPGLLPFVLPPEAEPSPAERAADRAAQTQNMAGIWVMAWARDRERVAGCAALLAA
ncbi:MAG: hypothetical protein H6702_10910 [Myxococcales bacterium]|nr:hypothetical protein [Myxococcales bacterium]